MIVYVHTTAIVIIEFTNISVKFILACFYYIYYLFNAILSPNLLEDRIVLND